METLEQLKAKHEKELTDAIRNHEMREKVSSELGLNDDNWSAGFMHVAYADCYIKMQSEDLSQAIEVAERLNPETLVRCKDGCLSFQPFEQISEKQWENADCRTICPYIYDIDGLRQYGDEKTLKCFVKAAGYMVQVRIKVKNDPDTHRVYDIHFNRYGEAIKERNEIINKSGYFNHQDKFWSSPDQPSKFVLWSD